MVGSKASSLSVKTSDLKVQRKNSDNYAQDKKSKFNDMISKNALETLNTPTSAFSYDGGTRNGGLKNTQNSALKKSYPTQKEFAF